MVRRQWSVYNTAMSPQRLPDPYAVLQVAPTAEGAVIEAAYRQLARLTHPDLNESPDAHARTQTLNEAYAVLRDPARRAAYDAQRAHEQRAATHLDGLALEGEWYTFRLGPAADAYHVVAQLEALVPVEARRWDARRQVWQIHADHAAALRAVFGDFARPAPLAFAPPPPHAETTAAGPLLAALAVCLVAAAILLYLVQTPGVVAWRGDVGASITDAFARLDPTASVSLTLVFLATLGAGVIGSIAYILGRPSR